MNAHRVAVVLVAAAVCAVLGQGSGGDPAALIVEGDALCRKEAYRSAKARLDAALTLARAAGDRGAEGDALAALARVEDGLGVPVDAARLREMALVVARGAGDRRRENRLLSDAGAGHWQRAEYDEAQRALHLALEQQRSIADHEGEATTLDRLGRVAFKQGRYNEALELFARALDIARKLPTRDMAIVVQVDIGLVQLDQRAYAHAIADFERALANAEAVHDVEHQVLALDQIGITYLFQNAPAEARVLFEQALGRARAAHDLPLEMKVQHLLANALRLAGEYHEAIAAYTHCAAFCAAEGNDREAAWNDVRRSRAERALGRLGDAERSLGRAHVTWERIGERRALAYSLYDLGRLQMAQGRDETAQATFARALTAQREIGLPYDSQLLSDMALLELRRGDAARAASLAHQAVERAELIRNPEMLWTALFAQARVERHAGRREEARRLLQRSLDVIEAMRSEVAPSDEAKAGFLVDKQAVYAEAVDLAFDLGEVPLALEIGERARARAFLDLLAAAPLREPESNRGAHVVPLLPSTASVAPATLAEMRTEVRRRGAVILAYFTAEPRSFVFAVEPSGAVRGAVIPLGATALRRHVGAVRRALEAGDAKARDQLAMLYGALIAPIESSLPRDPERVVVVIPHGPLSLLSFACLLGPDGVYLIERHTLSYVPAFAVLRHLGVRTNRRESVRLLAVGDPFAAPLLGSDAAPPELPAAATEARLVAEFFPPENSIVLTGVGASESRVRAFASHATTLHLATHALVRDNAPLASYLALAPGAGTRANDDGRLTAHEVSRMTFNADLVTLSACDTGVSDQGEGISGFIRAFLHAGARSIVVSLWRVADLVGCDQMARFYRALRVDRLDEAHALRCAQLGTLVELRRGAIPNGRRGALPETPLLWAPFVVIGESRARSPVDHSTSDQPVLAPRPESMHR